jgi:hypothetical protein
MEEELGEERQLDLFEGEPAERKNRHPRMARSRWVSTAAMCGWRIRKASLK